MQLTPCLLAPCHRWARRWHGQTGSRLVTNSPLILSHPSPPSAHGRTDPGQSGWTAYRQIGTALQRPESDSLANRNALILTITIVGLALRHSEWLSSVPTMDADVAWPQLLGKWVSEHGGSGRYCRIAPDFSAGEPGRHTQMDQDGVNTAFELMLGEIRTVIGQLNEEGAAAFRSGDYTNAQTLGETGKALTAFMQKVCSLQQEWNQGFDAATRSRAKGGTDGIHRRPHNKSPKTGLSVVFPDGTRICEPVAADSLVATIEKIGVEKVRELALEMAGVPIVARSQTSQWQRQLGQYWIMVHSSTEQKQKLLARISDALRLRLKVDIVR